MFRLERGVRLPDVRTPQGTIKPKRQWKLVAIFPHLVHPSAISNSQYADRNMLMGGKGQQCRVVDPGGKVVAIYEWGEVLENPGDPDSSSKVPGWKLIASPVPDMQQRNHALGPNAELPPNHTIAIPSVGADDYCAYVPKYEFDYVGLTGAREAKDDNEHHAS